jgi:uncharacterized membrane protein
MPDVSAFCPACGRSTTSEMAEPAFRERVLGAIAYVLLIPALIFLAIPPLRRSRFVSFHAWQAMFFFFSALILGGVFRLLFVILSEFPIVGLLIAWVMSGVGALGIVTLWVVLEIKAAQGDRFELPFIGPFAARLAS